MSYRTRRFAASTRSTPRRHGDCTAADLRGCGQPAPARAARIQAGHREVQNPQAAISVPDIFAGCVAWTWA